MIEENIEQEDLEQDVEPDSSSEGPETQEIQTPEPVEANPLQIELDKVKKEYQNLQVAIHQERGEKKALKEQLAQIAEQRQAPVQERPLYDDDQLDEVLTRREALELAKQTVKSEVDNLRQDYLKQQQINQEMFLGEQQTKAKYSDYDQVITNLGSYFAENPDLGQAFNQAFLKDPKTAAEKLYQLGKKVEEKTDKHDAAKAISQELKQPATMNQKSNVNPQTASISGEKRVEDMDLDEFAEHLATVKKRGKKAYEKLVYGQ